MKKVKCKICNDTGYFMTDIDRLKKSYGSTIQARRCKCNPRKTK